MVDLISVSAHLIRHFTRVMKLKSNFDCIFFAGQAGSSFYHHGKLWVRMQTERNRKVRGQDAAKDTRRASHNCLIIHTFHLHAADSLISRYSYSNIETGNQLLKSLHFLNIITARILLPEVGILPLIDCLKHKS